MKKSILLSAAVLMTITAFAFAKWNHTQTDEKKKNGTTEKKKVKTPLPFYVPHPAKLYYDIGSRFMPIKKSAIDKATTVRDFFTKYDKEHIVSVRKTNLILIKDDRHSKQQLKGSGEELSNAQLKYLRSCDYSINLKLILKCRALDRYKEHEEWAEYTPHFSIVPEQQASYELGNQAFIDYIEEGNEKNTYNLDNKNLGFAKLTFTVNENGSISDINLDRSSGYKKIDQAMVELLKNAPGKWTPALNMNGQTVSQELVISFGQGGC